MASVIDEKEDSLIEGSRQSLLEVVEERYRALNKKCLLHRMVLVSKLTHENFEHIGQYYERLYRDLQNTLQCEGVTGLLLIYPKHCVQVIEGSLEMVVEMTKDLVKESDGHTDGSKILIVAHDVPSRLYQHWSYRVLDIEAPRNEEYDTNEAIEDVATEMLTQLLKLGTYLARQPKVALKNAMDGLRDKVPELLPQQTAIGYLLDAEDMACIYSPKEYLDMYERPYDVVLDSELVWPMPVKLFPYN